jgi:Nitroreductase family
VINREIIRRILEAGAQAPSGSNSQPWVFEVKDSEVRVRMLPEKDHPILNFKNRGTLLAHGALIENIAVAAEHYGFGCDIRLLPEKNDGSLVAEIGLHEGQKVEDETLFDAIFRRTTNRKPYSTGPVSEVTKHALLSVPSEIGEHDVGLKLVDDRGQIELLARAASTNEIVMFENELLHKLFFDEIVWTEQELQRKKSGLYLETMELRPSQRIALHLFRRWQVMRLSNRLGTARSIAGGNARTYASCALYGAVLCGDEDKDFIKAGRVIERLWLKATSLGLSLHLQTGVNFLWQRQKAEGQGLLSDDHLSIIRREYGAMTRILDAKDRIIPALFRVGYSGEPSARSPKKVPEGNFFE